MDSDQEILMRSDKTAIHCLALAFHDGGAILLAALCAGLGALPMEAQNECQFTKLVAPNPQTGDTYGQAVALSGSRLVIGATKYKSGASVGGAAFVYERCGVNWYLTDTLLPNGNGGVSYGTSVAIEDDTILVGTKFDGAAAGQAGSAYVYEFDGGQFVQTGYLLPSIPNISMNFGVALEIDQGRIFVGASNDSFNFGGEGSVTYYEKVGAVWTEMQIIRPEPSSGGVFFGGVLSAKDDELFVGAPFSTSSQGEVFALTYDGVQWVQQQRIQASNRATTLAFGVVSYDGQTLAVGSPQTLANSGLVSILEKGNDGLWAEVQEIPPPPSSTPSLFGQSVCVDGEWMAVGAGFDSTAAIQAGAVHLYNKVAGQWVLVSTLTASDAKAGDNLTGSSTYVGSSMDGDIVVAGAINGDSSAVDSGAAYTWSISGNTCPTLAAVPPRVSLGTGGSQQIRFDAGPSFAGELYWILGSISGTDPGFSFAGLRIPLNIDDYFQLSLIPGPSNPLLFSTGALSDLGSANASLVIAPGTDPSLVGLQINHAAVAYSFNPLTLELVSNPASLCLSQ